METDQTPKTKSSGLNKKLTLEEWLGKIREATIQRKINEKLTKEQQIKQGVYKNSIKIN